MDIFIGIVALVAFIALFFAVVWAVSKVWHMGGK